MVGSETTDRPVAVVSIAGISLPLQIKQISNGYGSFRYQRAEAHCRCKSQNRFPAGNAGKLSAIEVNGFSANSFL
jgi:hypothetical protein